LNTTNFFSGLALCFIGGAVIWGFVADSAVQGFFALVAVLTALYCVLAQLNEYERHEINKHKKGRKDGDR
jgi:hypothetical protein